MTFIQALGWSITVILSVTLAGTIVFAVVGLIMAVQGLLQIMLITLAVILGLAFFIWAVNDV